MHSLREDKFAVFSKAVIHNGTRWNIVELYSVSFLP